VGRGITPLLAFALVVVVARCPGLNTQLVDKKKDKTAEAGRTDADNGCARTTYDSMARACLAIALPSLERARWPSRA